MNSDQIELSRSQESTLLLSLVFSVLCLVSFLLSIVVIIDRDWIASVLQFMDGSNSSHSNR